MRDFRRRLLACALMVVSSIVVTQTQQQQERGRGQQKSRADLAAAAGGSVTSVDSDGVPKFVWAAGARPGPVDATHDGAARWHLRQFARAYDVTSEEVSATDTVSVLPLKTGDVIVQLRQRYRGVEVMGSDVKVMMRPDHQLVAISGRPRATGGAEMRFEQSREAALAAALSAQFGSPVSASNIGIETMASGEERFRLAPGSRLYMSEAAPVRPVMFPVGGRLVAAYVTEFYAGTLDAVDALAFRYVVAADDGRVLERRDLTVSEKPHDPPPPPPVDFLYRVYAEPGNQRPLDGPQQDLSPHPTGFPDGTTSPFLPSNIVTMGGFNDPPSGVPDPWLAPDATETNGNNADAYVDFAAPDGLTPGVDFRADVTSARSFDRTYDTTLGPTVNVNQSKASITNAFYTVNWLHDYWYDSGFDEAAGNAQLNNFGRGGVEGDPMRVELQDNFLGGSRNNANMSTPSDGLRPRMQMYTWFGPMQATLTLTPGGNVAVGTASFGPTNFDITAQVALVNDAGGASLTDACEVLVGFVPGRIALADRGTCSFTVKARNAQAAGAVGILVANNVAGTTPPGLGGTDPLVTIGVFGITQAAGAALKTALLGGSVSAHMFRVTGTERDGALDNTIVAHEWGHYIHHRLADCGQSQCGAMSEGWGDFIAMHTIARDGDNLDGTYALATYATSAFDPNSAYFGIRRVPYSVDFTKNAFTFKHITDGVALPPVPTLPGGPNSEVHNAGEIWTTMLWEGYVALQKARGSDSFDDVRRRMADYVVGGLKMAPRDATFTEQRDAILATAASSRRDDDDHGHGGGKHGDRPGSADMLTLANAFARRGAGTCAVSPPRDSVNFAGVVESFDIRPRIGIGEIRLDEDKSCDRDGFVDAGERGTIVVPVMNAGPIEMRNTTVSITTSTPGVSFRHGSSARIARLDPFTTREAEIEIEVDRTFAGIGMLTVNVNVSNGESCEPLVSRTFTAWINVDEALNASNVDTVETPTTPWTAAGADADQIWSRVEVTPFNRAWFGLDFAAVSDTTLTSPALQVGSAPFVVEFDHKFGFETNGGVAPFFDGGVIEISSDNGATWADVNTLVTPGYGGTIFVGSGNPLGGRPAFVGRNASFPARDHLTLNFGTAFAGKTVRVRFRIGTDEAAADIGWEIDNIAFQGITNQPFAQFIADLAKCRGVPK
jgi:fungalysin metallopeptidase (M36)/PA domain-containing protein/fungalysin/thermolysin propeptide